MAQKTSIEWTEYSWNPVTGCSKISIGCKNCYAERMAKRLKAMRAPRYVKGFKVALHEDLINVPFKFKKSRIIFVNSMSDLFHSDVPDSFIKRIFHTMNQCSQHTFQILTKRAERLCILSDELKWTNNIWMGVTVESNENIDRILSLRNCSAQTKFLSCEPLLDSIPNLPLENIDWVIVGGESGPKFRPLKAEWAISIRDQCLDANVPYFFKQWGGQNKNNNGRILDGKIWDQMPMLVNE